MLRKARRSKRPKRNIRKVDGEKHILEREPCSALNLASGNLKEWPTSSLRSISPRSSRSRTARHHQLCQRRVLPHLEIERDELLGQDQRIINRVSSEDFIRHLWANDREWQSMEGDLKNTRQRRQPLLGRHDYRSVLN